MDRYGKQAQEMYDNEAVKMDLPERGEVYVQAYRKVFKDLGYEECLSLIHKCGFAIEAHSTSIRPYYGESIVEKLRHLLIEICKKTMPKKDQYMLSFSLKKYVK